MHLNFSYLCIVNRNDGIGAQGNKNLLSGLAKFSACPERKKEVITIMALKVKAVEKLIKFSKKDPGVYRYVMSPELYIALSQEKVIKEAALRSGVSKGVMQACWDAAGEVIKAWATEGHSVALPGLGTMRFGLRAKAVEKLEDVKS